MELSTQALSSVALMLLAKRNLWWNMAVVLSQNPPGWYLKNSW
jgi:hypothetical protein